MNKGRITIHLCSKDRHSEIALLLQSLRTQTYQSWDLCLIDDASGAPIQNCYFIMYMLNLIRLEGHATKVIRNGISNGVCFARNQCIDADDFDNEFSCRLDDDVIIQQDYLQKLIEVINAGYDIASGVTPPLEQPQFERDIKFVKPIINKHAFDKEGNLIMQNDDCGYCYLQEEIIPTHQFRSCALIKNSVYQKVRYETNLTTVGFREEGFFSTRAILAGYKIGVHTGAKALHFRCPSGGTRRQDYNQCVVSDDITYKDFLKRKFQERGDLFDANFKA